MTEGANGRTTPWEAVGSIAVIAVALGLATAALAVSPGAIPAAPTCARSWVASPPTATPIRHLFVIVKENHAFENYFGARPGVLGYPPNASLPTSLNGTGPILHPYPLSGYSTPDLPHDGYSASVDFNGGQNNLFVAQAAALGYPDPAAAAGYYSARQIPAYYAYASYYALGDRFFTGVLGPTQPNRVFDISSYVGAWNADSIPPPDVTDRPTILGQLTGANIPWNYDYLGPRATLAPLYYPALTGDPCSAARIAPAADLASQLANATAPSVVYLDPSNSQVYSEHPPENVTVGEEWTVAAVNTIFSSPVASSSAVLIFYDENGGYWDPVPPPMTTTGRDGFRVPFLVLSPWTPAGRVCSTTNDPASVLAFIDSNWGLPFLTPRVAGAANLSCFFDFAAPPRAPLLLPTNVSLTGGAPLVGSLSGPSASPGSDPPARSLSAFGPSEAFWLVAASAPRQEAEGS